MAKASLEDFFVQNPICRKFEGNPDFAEIFNILSQDESIIRMLDAADAGKPALGPCVPQIESYVTSRVHPAIDLSDDYTRQTIGRAVKTVLAPFGYEPTEPKKLPKEINAQFFSSASHYRFSLNASATMRVAKVVEEV